MNKRIKWIITACLLAVVIMAGVLVGCKREAEPIQAKAFGWLDRTYAKAFTFQDGVVITTTGTAMTVGGYPTVGVQVEGIVTATVTWQATIDGSTWYALKDSTDVTSGTAAATATADGLFRINTKGWGQLRANVTSWTSGTITIKGLAITH